MRQVRTLTPLVIIWTHQAFDRPGTKQPRFEYSWGDNREQIAWALARYLVDTKGDAVVKTFHE